MTVKFVMLKSLKYNFSIIIVSYCIILFSGCIHRTLTIKTEHPGTATVFIDGKKEGIAPLTIPFEYYGTHEIYVEEKNGKRYFQDIVLTCPWYAWFPLDFFSEVLYPGIIRNDYEFYIQPIPEKPVDIEELKLRAREARRTFMKVIHESE